MLTAYKNLNYVLTISFSEYMGKPKKITRSKIPVWHMPVKHDIVPEDGLILIKSKSGEDKDNASQRYSQTILWTIKFSFHYIIINGISLCQLRWTGDKAKRLFRILANMIQPCL